MGIVMRVNPQFVSNLVGSLDQASANQQRLSEEISSGVTINSLDQGPAAAGENVLLSAQMNADDTFAQTASSVESQLQVGDSALGSVVTQLTSAISLATEGANGVLDPANQQAIATQLSGIRDEVLSLANSTISASTSLPEVPAIRFPSLWIRRPRRQPRPIRAMRM